MSGLMRTYFGIFMLECPVNKNWTVVKLELFFYLQENQPTIKPPKDKLLAELILKHKELIWKIHDHDSLLENQTDEHLTEEERKAAWKEYEDEKKGIINMTSNVNLNMGVVMNNVDPLMIKVFHYKLAM